MNRYRAASFLLVAVLVAGFASAGPAASPARAASLQVCGEVSVYVKATALLSGALTIGPSAFVISAGTTLPAEVQAGANLCLDLQLNLSGEITGARVSANATATLDICGQVSAYVAATATATGSLTIHGRSLVVAAGAKLPSQVLVGADLCLHLTLNGFGQVTGATAQANVTSTLDVCGQVTTYVAAAATANGRLAIGSVDKKIAAGTALSSSVKVGAFLRLRLTIDVFGRIAGATVLKVGVSLADVCGTTATATPKPTGTPAPGGSPAPGATPTPAPIVDAGVTAELCGEITAYVAPSALLGGRLAVGGLDGSIAAGTSVPSAVKVGAFLRLGLHIDVLGRIDGMTVLRVGLSLIDACQAAPGATPTPAGAAGLKASPSPTPEGGAGAGATPSPERGAGGGAGGSGGGAGEGACPDDGAAGTIGGGGGLGGALPNTSSLARAGAVVGAMSFPAIALFAVALLLSAAFGPRRRATGDGPAVEDRQPGPPDEAAGTRSQQGA